MKILPVASLFALALALSPAAGAVPPPESGANNNSQGSINGNGHVDDGTDAAQGGHAEHGNGHGYGHGPSEGGGDHSVPELNAGTASAGAALLAGGVLVMLGRRRKKG